MLSAKRASSRFGATLTAGAALLCALSLLSSKREYEAKAAALRREMDATRDSLADMVHAEISAVSCEPLDR